MNKTVLNILLVFSILSSINLRAQQPQKLSTSDIYHQIEKLNFLGSVLYIAAHPDDENTKLISYLSNEVKAKTTYLSLTRGDGGQNLIGTELKEMLGVLRTQELLAARRIDGGEQLFSRAYDFGYSKEPEETFAFWNKEKVLADVVLAIRKLKPDVIINRFNHRTPGTTHGHHTASAMLSMEAFDKSSDTNVFPEQLNTYSAWQPHRIFFNTSWWFYGSEENFKKADKTNLFSVNTGVFYPLKGKSNGEIAALSRSQHQCQGFGSTGTRGDEIEYLEFLKGERPANNSIFEGINTTWTRVKGGEAIGAILNNIQKNFDFKNPATHLHKLSEAYKLICNLEDSHWREIKKKELEQIIMACCGLYLEAVAVQQNVNPNESVVLKLEAINRSSEIVEILSVNYNDNPIVANLFIENNKPFKTDKTITISPNTSYTTPYWLNTTKESPGLFSVNDINQIGKPETEKIKLLWKIKICDVTFDFIKDIVYKYNDNVKGEIYQPFDILPKVTSEIINKVRLFNSNKKQRVAVKVKAGSDNLKGDVYLDLPADWKVSPNFKTVNLDRKDSEQIVYFEVSPPDYTTEAQVKSYVLVDGKKYDQKIITIDYNHVPLQKILMPSEAIFNKVSIETKGKNIGYIMGAGDEIPDNLRQMEYNVTLIAPEKITLENVTKFDAVLIGIRAFNVVKELKFKENILFKYVENGGTLIVQYNTSNNLVTKKIAPYDLELSNDRVTQEDAEITFLNPNHKVLNYPNKISEQDFNCWTQEQGLYYPKKWAKELTPLISSHDKNEDPKNGALLVAKYGKGHYIYTGLSFFRQLPEGVTGAYRIMANLIAIGK